MDTTLSKDIQGNEKEVLSQALIDTVVESWRFAKLFSRMISKLDAGESNRYVNQYRFYLKRLGENLEHSGMRLVNLEGMGYDPGMAVTAINIEDFAPDDKLLVDQMVEPIIMGQEGLLRSGTIMLRRV